MKLLLPLIILISFSAVSAESTENIYTASCVARESSNGSLVATAYAYGEEYLDYENNIFLGAFYNKKKGTGYCQSAKRINKNEFVFETVKVLKSHSAITHESQCKFSGDRIHLNIDKNVISINESYSYKLKDGEHEFGSGDIFKIHFFPDFLVVTNEDWKKLSQKCQSFADALH